MSYSIPELTTDLIQRLGRIENAAGITLLGAANSIQSLITKKLLDRKSDLLVGSNSLSLGIAAQGCSSPLPDGFMAMAEKPKSMDLYTDWMIGNVTAYNSLTGSLTINVLDSSGTDTIADWIISTVALPGGNSERIASSTTSLAIVAVGSPATLTIDAGLTIATGTSLYITPSTLPSTYNVGSVTLQPDYLNEDNDHQDVEWWTWYGLYGWNWELPSRHPHHYKIIGSTIYVRPYVIYPVVIKGKYFAMPSKLIESSTIPWNGLFDEIFREGIVRIIQKGISMPDSDTDFVLFFKREFDTVINTRMHILPKTRTHHSNFM